MAGKKYSQEEINKIVELAAANTPYETIRETIEKQFGTVRPDSAIRIIYGRSKKLVAA